MLSIEKSPGKEFTILNLGQPQMSLAEWAEEQTEPNMLQYTVEKLMEQVQPDLVTVLGDVSWALERRSYTLFAEMMEKYAVPWAPVPGKHDYRNADFFASLEDLYLACPHCLYEKGDPALGSGNYVISITENGKPVEGLIMMTPHGMIPGQDINGNPYISWAKLMPCQIDWYKEQIQTLSSMGCTDTTLFMQMPLHGHIEAWRAAFDGDAVSGKPSLQDSYKDVYWKNGYKDSFGLAFEAICPLPDENELLNTIKALNSTKHVLCSHGHRNNFVIRHDGIRYICALKTGPGGYYRPDLNGGTVLQVGNQGIKKVWHEYVQTENMA